MKIRIDNPTDSFDLYEVREFNYMSSGGQKSKKRLNIRLKKYKELGDGTYAESDDPMEEIFIKDVDSHLISDAIAGRTNCANALGANILCVVDLLGEIKGINVTVEV